MFKILFLVLALSSQARAESFLKHDTQVHLLAHGEAGAIAALSAHFLFKPLKLKPWQNFIIESGAGTIANGIYEYAFSPKEPDAMINRIAAGSAGGVLLSAALNFKF